MTELGIETRSPDSLFYPLGHATSFVAAGDTKVSEEFFGPLLLIFNPFWNSGEIPEDWESATWNELDRPVG